VTTPAPAKSAAAKSAAAKSAAAKSAAAKSAAAKSAAAEPAPATSAGAPRDAVTAMLEARSIALVGASARPGSLGARMIAEVARSPSRPRTYLVNPRYADLGGVPCLATLAGVPEPVDLVLLAVPDTALEDQLGAAARRQDRSAVIFGSAFDLPGTSGLRNRLAAIAADAGMAVCGAGCMGFVNVARGLRAVGYLEPDPVPAGPVALITHSGSVFSAMLRARRGFGFSLAVSSGQELVTTAAAYARYALRLPETKVLALVLEAIRDAADLRSVLADALRQDLPVVLLSVGASETGKALVSAHSGALAAADGAWEALAAGYGVHRVHDLAELADTLELFASGRRASGAGQHSASGAGQHSASAPGQRGASGPGQHGASGPGQHGASGPGQHGASGPGQHGASGPGQHGRAAAGIATMHDSGLERAHVADLAAELGVPFAPLGRPTRDRLAAALDPGLAPANPLDVWGTGRDTEPLFTECLSALLADPLVAAVALAVDLVPEFDGDEAYPRAVLAVASATDKPVAVLAGLPAAVDPAAAARLRAAGVPVLEGTRSGLLALRHLLDHAASPEPPAQGPTLDPPDPARRQRWAARLTAGGLSGADLFDLLRDYGIPAVRARSARTRAAALAAAAEIGYPVVIKTDEPHIAHKSDVGGVRLGLAGPAAAGAAYDDLAARLGPRVLVCQTAGPGTELALGLVRDPALGPLLVVSAGGVLIEIFSERSVVLPPVTRSAALAITGRLRLAAVLAGSRGQPPADLGAIADAITGLSRLAGELGDVLAALDINPLMCGPSGAVAADVLVVPRLPLPSWPAGRGGREVIAMGHGRGRYLARAAVIAALIGLTAGCGSSSSSGSGASSSTTPGQAGRTATGTISASAAPASGFVAIVEPFDPGHPARVRTAPASCGSQPTTLAIEQCYQVKTENADAAIDAVQQAAYASASPANQTAVLAQDSAWLAARGPVCQAAFNTGGSIDGISVAACLLDESTARLDAVKGITPPEARLKASDSTEPNQLSWYTTPEGSRIAEINTQGDQANGEIVAWIIIGGADGFVINPKQFYFINGSLSDYGIVQPPDPTYHRVGTGVEYQFSIDYTHLPAVPPAAVEGYVYVPGTPVAIWQ
jgi:acetate---CoA ligase (ADP-forming)